MQAFRKTERMCKECRAERRRMKSGAIRFVDKMFNSWIKKMKYRMGVISRWSPNFSKDEARRRKYAYTAKWRARNPKYTTKWCRKNKIKARLYWHKRNSLINNADDGTVTTEALKAMMYRQKEECNECKKNIANEYHIDHIIPISKEGQHTIDNIQLLCPFCNLSKGNNIINQKQSCQMRQSTPV